MFELKLSGIQILLRSTTELIVLRYKINKS